MTLTVKQRQRRLRVRLAELRHWIDRAYIDLTDWTFDGAPYTIGEPWPTREGVVTLCHDSIEIPDGWNTDDVRLDIDPGGEALVRVLYKHGEDSFGQDPYHQRFPVRERSFSIEVSAVARKPFGAPARDAALHRARLVLTDPDVETLHRRLSLVAEAVAALDEHEAAEPLVEAGERAINALDWPSETMEYISRMSSTFEMQNIWALPGGLDAHPAGLNDAQRASVRAATEQLARDLEELERVFPRTGRMGITGHAHIDLAWLWPLDETRRKERRTYSSTLGLLDRYPEMRFNQSSAQLYAFLEEDDPALFARVREHVEAGRWEPIGGMWVEPDINMPSGESLSRQLLYGQRYFRSRFGRTHTICWLPDCFGFSPGLPQLLRLAGIPYFFTIKLTWSETNQFPYDLFWWEGLDGSRVLAHTFNNPGHEETNTGGYNADPGPQTLLQTWRNFRGKNRFRESLLSIGYGDGGGGPTREMIEKVRDEQHFPAIPEAEFTLVRDYFERLDEAIRGRQLPVWYGEMYLELHRGTLTTQGRTKYLHRRAERDLVAAEALASLVHLAGGPEPTSFEPDWRLVLRNEFHDILPGSGIREVYEEANAELAGVVERANESMRRSLGALAGSVVPEGQAPAVLAVNPDLSARPIRLTLQERFPGSQQTEEGWVLSGAGEVPGLSARVLLDAAPAGEMSVSTGHLENAFVRVSLAEDGTLSSVWDKRAQREALAGPGNQLWAYVDKPRAWDAWDVDAGYPEQGEQIVDVQRLEVAEEGPHRVAVRVERRFRNSTIRQDIRLWANSPRVEIKTTLDWHDRRWLLKARFPLEIRSPNALFETAFGVVERTTHRNTTWDSARFEVAGHRFALLAEPGYGVALLNDGKYGHDVENNTIGLSLLRTPLYPDPLAGEGEEEFTYALLPFAGTWIEGGVLMEAEDLNRPMVGMPVRAGGEAVWSPVTLAGLRLGLGALKRLEEGGGLLLRAYEPQGARGAARLDLPDGWSVASAVNLLEEPDGEPDLRFTPFQVRSYALRPES